MSFQEIVWDVDSTNHDIFLNNNLSILHFFSEWQMDCLMVLPIFESIAEEFSGKVIFGKVNIEEAEELAKKHQVMKVPSMLFFRNGNLIDRIDKFNSEETFRNKIMCLL